MNDMKRKYGISHLIAAWGYEEVSITKSEWIERTEDRARCVEYNAFPWSLMRDLGDDLAKMAGWPSMDNKVAFLVVMGLDVALICFYDCTCSLIKWSPWRDLPYNVHKGAKKVEKAYEEWQKGFFWEMNLQRRAREARTFGARGEKVFTQCKLCGETTDRREMGEPVCYDCAYTCGACGSTNDVLLNDAGERECEDCRKGYSWGQEELTNDEVVYLS